MAKRKTVTAKRLVLGPDPSGAAFAAWRERLAFMFDAVVPQDGPARFFVEGTSYQLPSAFLNAYSSVAQTMIRSLWHAAAQPIDQVSLFQLKAGRVVADYDGREVVLEAGDLVILDYMRPITSQATDFTSVNVAVPRAAAPAGLRSGDRHGSRVAAESPIGRLLGRQLDALLDVIAELTVDEAERVVAALLDLAARLWPEDPATTRLDDPTFDRAVAFIDAHVGDSALTPASIANRLGVGRSALYRAFAPFGGVSGHILKRRLDAGLLALATEEPRAGLVSAIAKRCGFKSSAHFARTFRARFGRSPSAVLEMEPGDMGGGIYADWFNARAREAGYDTVALWLKAQRP